MPFQNTELQELSFNLDYERLIHDTIGEFYFEAN